MIAEADEGLMDILRKYTGFQVGYADVPDLQQGETLETPWFMVTPIPGGMTTGGMGGNYEMTQLIYQLTTIGVTAAQAREAESRAHLAIDGAWSEIPGCYGPPVVSVGGIVRTDERTFNTYDTLYLEVTNK